MQRALRTFFARSRLRAQSLSQNWITPGKPLRPREIRISENPHSPGRRVHVCARMRFPIGLNTIATRSGGTACSQAVFIGTGPRSTPKFSPGGARGVSRRREPPVRGPEVPSSRSPEGAKGWARSSRSCRPSGAWSEEQPAFRGLTAPAKFLRPFGVARHPSRSSADFPHPALGQGFMRSHTGSGAEAKAVAPARASRSGSGPSIVNTRHSTPYPRTTFVCGESSPIRPRPAATAWRAREGPR